MRFPPPVREGRLIRRYKRFLADVELEGEPVTVHCANPGSMLGVSSPGARVLVSTSDRPGRKLPHSLEAIRVRRVWVGIHPLRANRVVAEALPRLPEFSGHGPARAERAWPGGGRADFHLPAGSRDRPAWIEVKNVTLAHQGRGLFPDAVTARGLRHLDQLRRVAAAGDRAVLILVASRPDIRAVGPADGIDPAYGNGFREAMAAGVEMLGYRMHVERSGLRLDARVPIEPGPHDEPARQAAKAGKRIAGTPAPH